MKGALLPGCIVLLLCAGLFYFLDPSSRSPHVQPAPDPVPELPPPGPVAETEPASMPFPVPDASDSGNAVAALIGMLESSRGSDREKALIRLGELGASARTALPLIEKIARDPEDRLRWTAMVAAMQIGESRQYYEALAVAAAFPSRRSRRAPRAFRRFDPALAEGILLAIRLSRGPRDSLTRPPGLERFLERMYEDEAAGVAEMNDRMRSARPMELLTWIVFLRRMKPVPTGVVPALRWTLEAGSDESRRHVLLLLGGTERVGPGLRDAMAPFLRDLAANAEPTYRAQLLPALGGLGASDPETMRFLRTGLGEGGAVADGAAASVMRLGPRARPLLDDLLRIAGSREPGDRYQLLRAVLATEDRRAIPFLREVLRQGHARERNGILEKVHEVSGAADLAPDLLALLPMIGTAEISRLLICAIRCDKRLENPESARLLIRALAEARPGSRRRGLYMIKELDRLPADVAKALAAALEHGREEGMVNPAVHAIRNAAKFGSAADPIAPVVLRLAGDSRFESAAVVALAGIRPQEAESAGLFRRAVLGSRSGATRRVAIQALGKLEHPRREDAEALQAALESKSIPSSSTARAVRELLRRPIWKALLAP